MKTLEIDIEFGAHGSVSLLLPLPAWNPFASTP